jgi:DNA-binding LacI/PurR family transcriptional regulator
MTLGVCFASIQNVLEIASRASLVVWRSGMNRSAGPGTEPCHIARGIFLAPTTPTLDQLRGAARPVNSSGRSRIIGVLSFDWVAYGTASALRGIQRATGDSGDLVSIVNVPVPSRRSVRTAVARLRRLGVDGILAVATKGSAVEVLVALSGDTPLVAVGPGPQDMLPAVVVDQYGGAAAVTRHLLDLGHRTVFHIAGPNDRTDPGPRLAGWRDTLVGAGAVLPLPLVGDWSAESGYELGSRLAGRRDLTAIFAANDQMALGVLRALFDAGRRVPQDVSVVGFDGTPQAEFFSPPLTTVGQDFTELGRRSLELLLDQIEDGPTGPTRDSIPAELILRTSTAPPA